MSKTKGVSSTHWSVVCYARDDVRPKGSTLVRTGLNEFDEGIGSEQAAHASVGQTTRWVVCMQRKEYTPVSAQDYLGSACTTIGNLSSDSEVRKPVRKPYDSCVLFTMSDDEQVVINPLAYKLALGLREDGIVKPAVIRNGQRNIPRMRGRRHFRPSCCVDSPKLCAGDVAETLQTSNLCP